jgi:putative lipoprotein
MARRGSQRKDSEVKIPAGSIWLVLAAAALFGCEPHGPKSDGLIVGTVTYRERIALPLNAVIDVRLEDLVAVDGAQKVLATHSIATESRQVPISFEMRYPPRLIDPSHRYGLRAEIRAANGKLLFASPEPEPVFSEGPEAAFVNLTLFQPGRAAATTRVALPTGVWRLVSMRREGASSQPMAQGPDYLVEFGRDGGVSGRAHCLAFSGHYTQSDWGQLAIFRLVAPNTSCAPPSRADEFLRALDRVGHVELRDADLVLHYGVGGELTFGR